MKSRAKKIIIWIIVILFILSTGLTSFVLYFTNPKVPQDEPTNINLEEYVDLEKTDVVVPNGEVDVNHPETTETQIVVTEKENVSEMDQVVEVPMENGQIDTPTVADFTDNLQLTQE